MGQFDKFVNMKFLFLISFLLFSNFGCLAQIEDDWCMDTEDYFQDHCQAGCPVDEYTACCLCTQYYYYSCPCCKDIVDKFGVNGDYETTCGPLKPADLDPEENWCSYLRFCSSFCIFDYLFPSLSGVNKNIISS